MSITQTGTTNESAIRSNGVPREIAEAQLQRETASRQDVPAKEVRSAELPRAASYTYVGDAKFQDESNTALVKDEWPEEDDEVDYGQDDDLTDTTPPDTSGVDTPEENYLEMELRAPRLRAIVAELQKSSEVSVQAVAEGVEEEQTSNTSTTRTHSSSVDSAKTESTVASTVPTTPRARSSIASNFSRLNRRSWISSAPTTPSRSPSPHKAKEDAQLHDMEQSGALAGPGKAHTKRRKSFAKRKDSLKAPKAQGHAKEHQPDEAQERSVSRKGTVLKKKPRPLSSLFKGPVVDENKTPTEPVRSRSLVSSSVPEHDLPAAHKPQRPPVPSLPKSFSTDRLPSIRSSVQPQHRAAPMPRLLSADKTPTTGSIITPRKKDELWSVFRALDGDLAKFQAKTLAFKANVVRLNLLPFLRTYASHPSNSTLRPEDLDRRTNILNKWWTGLIEMLHGRNNQSISGTDRPAILDGIAGIMERPEWRLPPSPFCPLSQRLKGTSTSRNQSSASLMSSNSDFLAESVYHNVRNIFIQNLSAQMAFVVDKMSLRNASASLVTFCGKACAYAFMFVPGMADVLVRLWDPQMDVLRRVLDGNAVGKFENLAGTAHEIVSSFPPALQQLGFTSLMKYMRKLRTPPPLPLGTNNFQWWGHWLERWSGRESDLFYVFVKYFHILATDFLPTDASKQERMCAPGFLLVHAQILTNLDATIHRDTNPTQSDPAAMDATPTFDDVLDPDAIASTLPLPPTNATRHMAENRMIMLIRDFLSERAAEHPIARRVFAESFNDLLQTAARGTSIFDHYACYTLLDFLEEALHLLIRFEKLDGSKGSVIDLGFWTSVWKKMVESYNTMTEVRLYAFLYTVWNTVICELGFKSEVCATLVLDPDIFESRFNHWCPMVRAYYMRLLCWRVGRYDGEPSPGCIDIFETLWQRLHTTWSHYLFLREQAVRTDSLAPSTSPCNPAPSRRLLIIRTDPQVSAPVAFLSFDGLVQPKSPPIMEQLTPTALKRFSSGSQTFAIEAPSRPESAMSVASDFGVETRGRGIGGFLKNLVSASRSKSRGRRGSPSARAPLEIAPAVPSREVGIVRAATEDTSGTKTSSPAAAVAVAAPPAPHQFQQQPQQQQPQPQTFRAFSFKFSLEYNPHHHGKSLPSLRLSPPRLPLPAHQHLQTFSSNPAITAATGATSASTTATRPLEPQGAGVRHARYCGRALAEWAVVVGECQGFFERRRGEGVMERRWVETPALGVEAFRRPG